jgi:hypothetical protein
MLQLQEGPGHGVFLQPWGIARRPSTCFLPSYLPAISWRGTAGAMACIHSIEARHGMSCGRSNGFYPLAREQESCILGISQQADRGACVMLRHASLGETWGGCPACPRSSSTSCICMVRPPAGDEEGRGQGALGSLGGPARHVPPAQVGGHRPCRCLPSTVLLQDLPSCDGRRGRRGRGAAGEQAGSKQAASASKQAASADAAACCRTCCTMLQHAALGSFRDGGQHRAALVLSSAGPSAGQQVLPPCRSHHDPSPHQPAGSEGLAPGAPGRWAMGCSRGPFDGQLGAWSVTRMADSDGRLGWPTRMADSDGRLG